MRTKTQKLLSDDLLNTLAERGEAYSFEAGEVLIREGDIADALYILVHGRLKAFTRDKKGHELVLNMLGRGEFFGEMLLDGGRRSASVKAVASSLCVVVTRAQLNHFLRDHPEFTERLVTTLIGRLRHATRQLKALALDSVYKRTIDLLNDVAIDRKGARVILPEYSDQEIADRVGSTRKSINYVFRDLVREGYLREADGRPLTIVSALPKDW